LVPLRLGTPAYMLQAKTKGNARVHMLPRAIALSEPASLLREGFGAATCPRLRIPPLRLGGFRRCHVSRGSGPPFTIQEGFGAATRHSVLDLASPLRRGPTLTRVLWLYTAPASEVGSGANACPMALHRPWAVEIKEGLAATACSEAHVFRRYVRTLPRRLQDVQRDCVIMTCKPCGHALQHHTTVHHHAANRSQAWCYSTTPCS
jgi:hypothetical protein